MHTQRSEQSLLSTVDLPTALPAQLRRVVSRVMRDVQAMAPLPEPRLEELRMRYPPVGCWAPMYVPDPDARPSTL